MVRREASALVWDAHAKLMKDSISLAFQYEPLPHPPLELPDFPALTPAGSTDLAQQALGITSSDRAGFRYRLEMVIESIEPDYVKRNIDPEASREKWMSKNAELIGEKILILTIKDWLILALDESVPNADRWYLASSVLIGLTLNGSKIARDGCFHLFSSIVVARPPGNWPINKVTGPFHMEWNDNQTTDFIEETAHPTGTLAANAILDILSMNENSANSILPYWLENLALGPHVSSVLSVPNRIESALSHARGDGLAVLIRAGIQSFSNDSERSREILSTAILHEDISGCRTVASNLSRIESDDPKFALELMEKLLVNPDSDTRILATTYLGGLSRSDTISFTEFAKLVIESGDERMVQRLVESGIRYYLSVDSKDSGDLIPALWVSSNLSARSQLSGLLLELGRINPDSLTAISRLILEIDPEAHNELFKRISMRSQSIGKIL